MDADSRSYSMRTPTHRAFSTSNSAMFFSAKVLFLTNRQVSDISLQGLYQVGKLLKGNSP